MPAAELALSRLPVIRAAIPPFLYAFKTMLTSGGAPTIRSWLQDPTR